MPAFLSEMLSQVRAIWARLDGGQRLIVAVVILATVAGIGGIVWFAGRPDFQVVYSSAEAGELMRAARALDQAGVGYRIEGGSLAVDTPHVDAARRALMGSAIEGGTGAPSDLAALTSDKATRMHLLSRQVERDAERNLLGIRGVIAASVSHSKPERSPYRIQDNETQPRANVGLRIAAGTSFGSVAQAARQEAAAALGMPPEFITITNLSTGQVFTENRESGSTLDGSEFLEQQRRRSEELTDRAQGFLNRAYPDKALVLVTVVLDPEWKLLKERSAPDKQLIKRTVTTKEDTVDAPSGSGGDPSAASSAIGTAAPTSASGPKHKKESKETEYSIEGFKETSTGRLAPDIRKMTVALVVDESIVPDGAHEQALEAAIKSAIGWSDEWAEPSSFTIHKTKLPDLPALDTAGLTGFMPMLERWGPSIGQVVAVLLVLLFLRSLLRKGSTPASRATAAPKTKSEAEAAPSPEDVRRKMRREIETAITEDPEAISRLLDTWLTESSK